MDKSMNKSLGLCGALFAGVLAVSGCASTQQITSGNTNMCVNVVNHVNPVPGAPIIVRPCDPWKNQQWSFSGGGQITGVGGFCVDVQGSLPTDGAKVIYTPCDGAPSQNWTAGGNGTLVGIGGKCLDIGGGDPVQGAPLVINACNGSPSQQWVSH